MHRPASSSGAADARTAADLLRSAFQAELDAVHRSSTGGQAKGEVYKPPAQASPGAGAWGSAAAPPKPGKMADGRDVTHALAAAFERAKAATA